MKVTYNWLKDFLEINISPRALAEKLTMAGLEVTSLEEKGGDAVFEIEITSNRPDWLSVEGIAREAAAILGRKLKRKPLKKQRISCKRNMRFALKVENRKDCPLYTARIIRGVGVGPSPERVKDRLELLGCRSVNNIVDATNYILFERGEPLHAFDLDKLKGGVIIVRRAKDGEKIITIDGQTRELNPGILVIADRERPVAVAGVMGSQDTEVTEATRNILLEAAVFDPVVVRRGRRELGIQSDSSYRFERGVNAAAVEDASRKAAELIRETAQGECVFAAREGLAAGKKQGITLDRSAVKMILGIDIPASRINKILNALEFKAKRKANDNFIVGVPSHRSDAASQVDLIEEITRIYGYANIPQTQPSVKPQVACQENRDMVSLTKNILAGLGLNEVITYSLMDKDLLGGLMMYEGQEVIEIQNPLSREQEILRPRLVPGLAACVAYNLNQKQEYINIFEVAKVFSRSESRTREELKLGIALCGTKSLLLQQGLIKDPAGILQLKGVLEALFTRLGIREYNFAARENTPAITIYAAGEKIGLMSALDKPALEKLEIKNRDVFVAELSLERMLFYINLNKKFSGLAVYPGISRDISLLVKESAPVGDILEAIKRAGEPLLKEAQVTDYYKGKQIPSGFKGLTISCFYRSHERTLTEAEINPAHSLVCKLLADKFGAQIR